MRFLFLILAILSFAFSKDNFWLSYEKDNGFDVVRLNIGDDFYIYQNSIKIVVDNEDITNMLQLKPAQKYNEYEVYKTNIDFNIPDFVLSNKRNLDIYYQGCTTSGLCYPPYKARIDIQNSMNIIYQNKQDDVDDTSSNTSKNDDEGYFDGGFILSVVSFFVYGVLMSLTPCVLPMVPILSSIIIQKSSSKLFSSVIYVLGMSLAYTIVGVLAALFGQNLNALFQSDIVLIAFSLIFVFLAFGSFGVFSIQMPMSIQDKLNLKSSSLAGNLGVFFMGVLSALIVGPCVGAPLAGALLYIANTHDVILGGLSLFALSVGMGIPLIVIGFGFDFIKSGDFMKDINKLFGFIMLGVANYFIARVLNNDTYYYLSYAVLLMIFAFSFSVFGEKKSLLSKIFTILCFVSFGISCVFIYKVSVSYVFIYKAYNGYFNSNDSIVFERVLLKQDYEKALQNDKVMVYFTASWCANCKELSNTTFKDINIINALKDYKKIKIDITNADEFSSSLLKQYSIFGPPAILFFHNQKLVLKKIGYKNSLELLEGLEE